MRALQVPDDDPTVQIVELEPDDVILPGGASHLVTVVEITMFAGRSLDTKRELYREIVSGLAAAGAAPEDVSIVLHAPRVENWGVRGGVPASEVDVGFRVDI